MYGTIIALSLLILALGLGGCVRTGRGIQVIPQSHSRGILDLSADDIVAIMRAAGFSDEQIVEHGTAVHDGLCNPDRCKLRPIGRWKLFLPSMAKMYISSLDYEVFSYTM